MLFRLALVLASFALLTGCSSMKPEQFADTGPRFILEEYFQGQSRAYGIVQDWSGDVRRQFVADISGTWDGGTLTLVEDFVWSDGEVEQRIWTLRKLDDHTWEGTAGGVIGTATGKQYGNAFNLRYDFDLKLGSRTIRVHFDDWMFLQPDGVVLNRASMRKFGIELATITISFKKQPAVVQQAAVPAAE